MHLLTAVQFNSHLYFLFHLLLIQQKNAIAIDAICYSTCICGENGGEFRVDCKGRGNQELILDTSIFNNTHSRVKTVYVKIQNYSSLDVSTSFLTKWHSYESCAFDMWYIGNIVLPKEMNVTLEDSRIFAGIGIIGSQLTDLPIGLMRKTFTGLKISNSNITQLDMSAILGESTNLRYLQIRNSKIGLFHNSFDRKIRLRNPNTIKEAPSFVISRSTIDSIEHGALSFENYQDNYFGRKALVQVTKSMIGVIEKDAMYIGKGVSIAMNYLSVGVMKPFAMSMYEGFSITIVNNTIGVLKDALPKDMKCGKSVDISGNIFYSSGDEWLLQFLDQTCGDNTLFNLQSCEYQDLDQHAVPLYLFYFASAAAIVLFIILVIVLAIFCCRKRPDQPAYPISMDNMGKNGTNGKNGKKSEEEDFYEDDITFWQERNQYDITG